jgi:hypothetical protein
MSPWQFESPYSGFQVSCYNTLEIGDFDEFAGMHCFPVCIQAEEIETKSETKFSHGHHIILHYTNQITSTKV